VDINPKLLERMQNDPKATKEYTQRLKDVESVLKWLDNYKKAVGSTVIVRHDYIDENGIPWMSKEQADRCITGRSDWKKIVSVSDEVKADLAEIVKEDFISSNGKSIPEGTRRNDVINRYLSALPSTQRSSDSWTLDRMAGDYGSRLEALVKKQSGAGTGGCF